MGDKKVQLKKYIIQLKDGKDPVFKVVGLKFMASEDDSLLLLVMSFILKLNTQCGFM